MTAVNNTPKQISSLNNNVENYMNAEGAIEASRAELEDLFDDAYFNAGEKGQEEIQKQIDKLEKAITALQEEADELQDRIDDSELSANKKGEELADIVGEIGKRTAQYQQEVKLEAKQAAYDAIDSYRHDPNPDSFENCYEQAFKKRITGIAGINMSAISNLYDEYDAIKDDIKGISSTIEGFLDEAKGIDTKLDNTNATINLLTKTRDNMSDTIKGAYENNDMDNKVPIFSGDKAEVANDILATYQSRYTKEPDTDATTAPTGASKETKDAAKNAALANKTGTYSSNMGDIYNASTNPELANLNELVRGEMLEDLQKGGLNVDEIMTFVSENWNVGIDKNKTTGNWVIPYGHGSDKDAYNSLRSLVENSRTLKTAEDVNQTQMLELKKAVEQDGVLTKMYKAGFTFKEAMYTLTKAFPDAGITYDLNSQSTERNYGRVEDAGKSGELYETIRTQILDYWDVGGTDEVKGDDSTTGTSEGKDPIVFQDGSKTYTFITDRDDNGKFDYTNGSENDLLGSKEGMSELLAYDYNGDGKINANDKDADGNSALDQLTLMVNNQIESVDNASDVDQYKEGPDYTNSVDFDITYTNATQAGITEIDLTHLKDGNNTGTGDDVNNTTKTYDNVQETFEDINGSSVINSFTIKMNDGSTHTGLETLNSESNLETFYGQVADNNTAAIYSQLTDGEINDAFNTWYNEDFANLGEQLDGMIDNLENLKEQADLYEETIGLGMSKDEFYEMFGADGKSGEYIDAARTSALRGAERHTARDEQEESATEVGKELDKLNESIKVVVDKTDKKEADDNAELKIEDEDKDK